MIKESTQARKTNTKNQRKHAQILQKERQKDVILSIKFRIISTKQFRLVIDQVGLVSSLRNTTPPKKKENKKKRDPQDEKFHIFFFKVLLLRS